MTVRLFIAVEIENTETLRRIINLRDELLTCSKGGRGIKGVEDENIHLTIRFIGEVSEALLPSIINCLKPCGELKSFMMEVKGVGAFPSISRPRVIWVGVSKGSDELKMIRKIIDKCLNQIVRPEPQEFVPHITIGRIKGSYDRMCLQNFLNTHVDEVIGESKVTKIKLKRSILRPQGPEYHDVYEVNLRE
ncbi:MAG: RNA 2',3'-cyclic phosphodiesterase [Desulfurococcales archaeon ex4484_42]|nr:MAG: RNA 2',3'-cyclic phosphodiesterase [Desulfurococcales archaeon ex4484_42]